MLMMPGKNFGIKSGINNAIKKATDTAAEAEANSANPTNSANPANLTYQSEDGKISTNSADQASADLIRADWDNFVANDMEYILNYSDEVRSDKYTQNAVDQAESGIKSGFQTSSAAENARRSGLGLKDTTAQRADRNKDNRREMAASLVDASNSARDSATDRQNALLAGTRLGRSA
jgi:hypothetical protein